MSAWIKICGTTSIEDARLAVQAGANAVGFVFAPSPRHVTLSEAAAMGSLLPDTVQKIGVFVDAGWEEIYSAVRACGLTGVQLHFEPAPGLAAKLKEHLGPELWILRAIHFGADAAERVDAVLEDSNIDAILIDSRTAGAVGGTGIAFDWAAARASLIQRIGPRKPLVVAGGLNPENVAEAIATLQPWGVDVVSGVEAEPGLKDPFKVKEFIRRARAAYPEERPEG